MRDFKSITDFKNVGFISTRIAGTDGVSLEIEKWAEVFEQEDFKCFYFAGELDRPPEQCHLVPEAHFTHPEIKDVYQQSFGTTERSRAVSKKIYQLAIGLKDHLYDFADKFDLHIIVPENALTIPLNIPLGIALTEFIAETNIHTVAHHHDFYWERDRFMINADGHYAISLVDRSNETEYLAEPHYSQHLKTGYGVKNRLRVEMAGSKFRFLANGRLLTEVQDNTLESGAFGLGVLTKPGSGSAEARFDNFQLATLPGTKVPEEWESWVK